MASPTTLPSAPAPRAPSLTAIDPGTGLTRAQRATRTASLLDQAVACTEPVQRRAILDEVVVINRGVAESVASRYDGRGIAHDDLVQVACEGLVKAVRGFDPATRNDLLTFAVPTMRGHLMRHFRDHGWTVRPPRRLQELQWRVNKTIGELEQTLGREPLEQELLDELGIDHREYAEAVAAFGCFSPPSIDQPVSGSEHISLGDAVEADDAAERASEARLTLGPAVERLSARDRRIIDLRFVEERSQSEMGRDLGISQAQVSRELHRVLALLRAHVGEDDVEHADDGVEPAA